MILGISGTHGTGKSTVTQALKNWIQIDESQLSRSAQKSLGWDKLSIAGESVENMWALQEAILAAMYDRDIKLAASEYFIATERTPADVWAYTVMWCLRLGIDPLTDAHAQNYLGRCREMANRYYAFIIVPMTDAIPFVVDPNRADLKSREMVADIIDDFLDGGGHWTHTIFSTDRMERAREAVDFLAQVKVKEANLDELFKDKDGN